MIITLTNHWWLLEKLSENCLSVFHANTSVRFGNICLRAVYQHKWTVGKCSKVISFGWHTWKPLSSIIYLAYATNWYTWHHFKQKVYIDLHVENSITLTNHILKIPFVNINCIHVAYSLTTYSILFSYIIIEWTNYIYIIH